MNEFDGWKRLENDPFEQVNGPFYYRIDEHGEVQCAFRARENHMNIHGAMHGGCMMSFADFALFAFALEKLDGQRAVTISMSHEFLAPARVGQLIEARGSVVKNTGALVFVRGLLTANGKPMLNFSGILRKIKH